MACPGAEKPAGPIDIFDIIWIITIYVGSAARKGPATPHREPKHEDRTFKVQPPPRRPEAAEGGPAAPPPNWPPRAAPTSNGNPPAEAGLVNDGTAGTPYDGRKLLVPNNLRLDLDEFPGGCRSATLPNDPLQTGGV